MGTFQPVAEAGGTPAVGDTFPLLGIDKAWVTLLAVTFCFLLYQRSRSRSPLPPGPPALPILGHLHLIPKYAERYKTFARWSKQHGPVVSYRVGSQNFLVLGGDGTVLSDLVDKRGALYSGRPDRQLDKSLDGGESVM